MSNRATRGLGLGAAGALIIAMLSSEVSAEAMVLRSNVHAYPYGRIVATGTRIDLRATQSIELLAHDGSTFVLSGPVNQRLAEPERGAQQIDSSVWGAFLAMFRLPREQVRLGGVRGDEAAVAPRCDAAPPSDDWQDIAADWNAGCKPRALARLDTRLKAQSTVPKPAQGAAVQISP